MADRAPPLNPKQGGLKQGAAARPLQVVARGEGLAARPNAPKRAVRTRTALKFPSLFAELKSLAERGGAALGDAYTSAASSVLTRIELLEDRNAERRYRQRAAHARSVDQDQRANEALPPAT
jgi:hypothetical protein